MNSMQTEDWKEEQQDLIEAVRKQDLMTIHELLVYFKECWPKPVVANMALAALEAWTDQ